MSQIAEVYLIENFDAAELASATKPQSQLLSASFQNDLNKYLSKNAIRNFDFPHQGHYLVTLLVFLEEHNINLLNSHLDSVANELSKNANTTICIIPGSKKSEFSDRIIKAEFSPSDYDLFCEEFYEAKSEEHQLAMRSAFEIIKAGICQMPDSGAIFLMIS